MGPLRSVLLCLAFVPAALYAQTPATPVSGDITVSLAEPIDFATARLMQAVRSHVVKSTNPAIPAGSNAVLQLQNRDGSYTLKLLRIGVPGAVFKTMSMAGVSVSGPPASGPHASLAAGAMVRFTLTQEDGSPGPPIVASAPSATPTIEASEPAAASTTARSGSQYPFSIEGIGLRMSFDQVRAAAKAAGSAKGLQKQGPTTYNLDTRDLGFQIEFTPDLHVTEYNVTDHNPKHLKDTDTSGPLHDRLVKAFGDPSTWGNAVVYDLGETGVAYAIVHDPSAQ